MPHLLSEPGCRGGYNLQPFSTHAESEKRMNILFYDFVCPKPYDYNSLENEALGGTEATVIRVAKACLDFANVTLWQHNSKEALPPKADIVVCLRDASRLMTIRAIYPNAKIFLWLHDIVTKRDSDHLATLLTSNAEVVFVSKYHQTQGMEALKQAGLQERLINHMVYNPIDEDLVKDKTTIDSNKLLFFSSPHKGLELTLRTFLNFKSFPELKEMQLYVANPGYLRDADLNDFPNVVSLGALTHQEVIKQLRTAFAVFHLNTVFPETFGLVYAEAQAVGTPFMTYPIGAVEELSDHVGQLVNAKDPREVIERMLQWKKWGRPIVRLHDKFRTRKVIQEWKRIFRC